MDGEGTTWDQKRATRSGFALDVEIGRPERSGERPLSLAIAPVGSHRTGITPVPALSGRLGR